MTQVGGAGAKVAALAALAMVAFAANSVLARLALLAGDADAWSYTGVRLASGAVVLVALVALRRVRDGTAFEIGGGWAATGALFGYAILFSLAYLMLGAATGALLLFASVQIGMIGWAVFKGDRPGVLEWAGLAVALAALVYLVSPGLVAPDPLGALLMGGAGLCWAAYTLLGRGSQRPLVDTAGNFVRCLPLAVATIVIGLLTHPVSWPSVGYAIASGALASGLGYAVWYAVLPAMSRTRAAIIQLTVPAIAAAAGVILISEPLTVRLVLASVGILGGVATALVASERRRSRT